jgi:N-formylglutamate amidohydrolase
LRYAVAAAFRHEYVTVGIGAGAVLLNDPFRGGYLCRHHGISGPLPWVQFEINRALYLPEEPDLTEIPGAASRTRLGGLREKFIRGLKRML